MTEEKEIVAEATSEVKEEAANVMESVVRDENAEIITMKQLLEAGVHFGHQTRKWNPKMKPYIYCPRNGVYIIDLNKTKEGIEAAYAKLKEIVTDGGKVLLVGTKENAKEIVKEEAERSGSFYINNRWLGGILTNFKTIRTRTRKLKDLEAAEVDGEWDKLPKKEASKLVKEKEKLAKNLEGIKEMVKVPNALIVVDPTQEHNAILEARKLHIPVFAICDTNCDPDGIDYVIPGNDDANKSVKLIVSVLNDAIVEAKGGLPEVAYLKEEGTEEVTMKDALRQADRENALRIAARREMQREKLEREKARREAFAAKREENKEGAQEIKEGEKPTKKPIRRAPKKTEEVKEGE